MSDIDITPDASNPAAPWGYEEDGSTPKAPLGYKSDGKPRISNRGRKAGGGTGVAAPRRKTASKTRQGSSDSDRKKMLVDMVNMWVATPLAGASASPVLVKRIGEKQTDALAGDAVIISHYAEPLADGLITLSHSKPGVLAWLDTVEEKAPWMMLAMVGVQMSKAFVENHLNPNPDLAAAGRLQAAVRTQKMIAEIEAEARAMGIPTDAPMSEVA